MSSIPPTKGKCRECPDTDPEKYLSTGLCSYHKKRERNAVYAARKEAKESDPDYVPKERKAIRRESKKLERENRLYREKERPEYLSNHEYCEARLKGCTHYATDIHHKEGRGVNLRKMDTFLAVCRNCHDKIEANPEMAKANNLSSSRLNKK